MTIEQKVYDVLDNLAIPYEKFAHKALYTVDEANKLDIYIPGVHCKNLFIRNRKGKKHYLVILKDTKQANLKGLSKQVNSTNLSFASPERLFRYLKLMPGSVTPFGLINDSDKHVEVLIDNELKKSEYICFHPNVNTVTITIPYSGFEKFLKWCGNKVRYVDI